MKAIVDGSHPRAPIQDLMGFDIVEAEDGRTVFSSIPGPQHLNPIGVVHGGFAGLLLDSCMGAAVHTTCAEDEVYSTLETKFNLVRAITPGAGEVLAEGRVCTAVNAWPPPRDLCAARATGSCSRTAAPPA